MDPTHAPWRDPPRTIGRYEIVKELGRGSMGIVYEARDPQIGRSVVIKVVQVQGAVPDEERQLRERFHREAVVAGRLSHPGIVMVHDVGRDEPSGAEFIAMEMVPGATLQDLARSGTPLGVEQVISDMRQVAEALDFAHAQGVVHRDVKPSNILIREDGKLKVADFGIARLSASSLTSAGQVLGSPGYMSPEQVVGQPVDGQSDQFSLAVVIYELLAGRRPFDGDNISTVLHKVTSVDPTPLHELRKELPRSVSDAVLRALSKNRAGRYASCREMMTAIEEAWERSATTPVVAPTVPPVMVPAFASPIPGADPVTRVQHSGVRRAPRRGPWRLAALAVTMSLIGVVGSIIVLRELLSGGPPRTVPTPSPPRSADAVPPEPVARRPDSAPPKPPTAEPSPSPEEERQPDPSGEPTKTTEPAAPTKPFGPATSAPLPTAEPAASAEPTAGAESTRAVEPTKIAEIASTGEAPGEVATPTPLRPRPTPLRAPPTPLRAPPTPLLAPPPPVLTPPPPSVPSRMPTPEVAPAEPDPGARSRAKPAEVAYVFVPRPGDPMPRPLPPTNAALIVAVASDVARGRIEVVFGTLPVLSAQFDGAEHDVGHVELPGIPNGTMRTNRRFPIGVTAGEHQVTVRIFGTQGDVVGSGVVEVGKGQACVLDVNVGGGQLLMRLRCS